MTDQDVIALHKTIAVYSTAQFAAMYFARWRTDLPLRQLDAFSQRLSATGTVLDAGCGPGHHSAYLHTLGHHVIGIDLSEESLQIARAHFPGPKFKRMDMLSASFPDSHFAGIWACASVMHLPRNSLEPQLVEFHRLLSGRGVLALTMTVDTAAHEDAFGRFFETYSAADLTTALVASGFEIVDQETRVRGKNTEQNGEEAKWITITSVTDK
ncbi:MAG: class I SAM-dependent methyltransferase [Methylobacter sp.]|jgi:SAM-dependent methyltransferase|nr:class I SAM-dependent methyltransferase [Methylobacter sp.]